MKTALLASMLGAAAWSDLPPLSVATGGQSVGVSHGALIVAGGSRFDKPPYEGGTKEWLDFAQLLTPGSKTWQRFPLGARRAYSCAVSYNNALYLTGGSDERGPLRSILRLEFLHGRLLVQPAGELPLALSQHGCALRGSTLFLAGGLTESGRASERVFALDLALPGSAWHELEPLPGGGRILPVCAALGSSVVVFGGAALAPDGKRTYLRTGFTYTESNGWRPAEPLPRPAVAAPSLVLPDGRLAVFGGDDGALDGRMAELKENHPGFPRQILLYDGHWQPAGDLPLSLVTTGAALWQNQVVLPGGEDRPGHRSARVLSLPLDSLKPQGALHEHQ